MKNPETRSAGSLVGQIVRAPIQYLGDMLRDMRYALRVMIKSPAFALVGILSMGIGIGLTTVVYSSEWKLITQDLPAAGNARQLVMTEKPVSYYYIEQFREEKRLFTGVAAFRNGVPFNLTLDGDASGKVQRAFGQLVSADYFSVLGVKPQRGRVFSPGLDKPGNPPVVVVTDRFWRNHLNSSPDAVGQTLRLNRQSAVIVGITPKDFNGALALNPADLFIPITAPPSLAPELGNNVLYQHHAREFTALLARAPGVTIDSAEAALDAITRRLDEDDHSAQKRDDKGRRVSLLSAATMVPLPRRLKVVALGFYLVLMTLIITIACMNLANVLLARSAARQKELAIRLAIGAGRFRLMRQMVSEGILLSLLGGVAGFALAYAISKLNSQFKLPTTVPIESNFTPDWRAAMFVFIVAIICGVAFSMIPALRVTKADMTPAFKGGAALQVAGYRRFGVRNLLIVLQVTGSLMLLLITGFLVLGIRQASSVQTKFDPRAMYLFSLDPIRDGYARDKAEALFHNLPQRLQNAAAVRSVVLAAQPPFSVDKAETVQLLAQGRDTTSWTGQPVAIETVGAGYFIALNESMLAGRDFVQLDQRADADASSIMHVILNQSAARGFFGNENAVGRLLKSDKQSYEVVGVVPDLKNGMGEKKSIVYLPLTQQDLARPLVGGITVIMRSDPGVDAFGAIRREMSLIDPNLNLFNVRTLDDYLELSRAYERYDVDTYGGIGLFGLVLAAVGLAGVTAYAVAQRRKEIAIRMALGARRGQVLLLVLREGLVLVSVGTLLGLLGAFAISKILSSLTDVFVNALKIGASDVMLLAGAPLLLAGLALLACYVPARRAAKIDPLQVLREV